MSFTLIDHFNGFQTLKQGKRFSAGVQSTYFALLAEFNRQRFPAELSISTRDLKELAGLKSVATAHECRNVLKNNKLIEFETKTSITVYRLLTEHLPNSNRTLAEHQPNGNRTLTAGFNMRAGGESRPKTEDFLKNNNDTRTRELKESNELKAVDAQEHASELDAILDEWQTSGCFAKLDFQLISELDALLKKLGVSAIREAMDKAKRSNNNRNGVSFSYFKAVLENTKGEKSIAKPRTVSRDYDAPTANVPWD